MRRRSKPGLWLPPDPDHKVVGSIVAPSQCALGEILLSAAAGGAGTSQATSVPLVGDYNEEIIAGTLGFSLADEVSGGYRLRRVVGKIWVAAIQEVDDDVAGNPTTICVTAGLIVRRVNTLGDPVSTSIFPDAYENLRDPYLWRRGWVLTNYLATGAATTKALEFPTMNADYGSVMDGPHIDAKTKRFIGAEERLFMDVSMTYLDGDAQSMIGPRMRMFYDLRFFAFLATQGQGNRRNASR